MERRADRVRRTLNHELTARYLFPEEVPPLLERCGYEVTNVYGDFQRGPLEDDSTEQIWVAVSRFKTWGTTELHGRASAPEAHQSPVEFGRPFPRPYTLNPIPWSLSCAFLFLG